MANWLMRSLKSVPALLLTAVWAVESKWLGGVESPLFRWLSPMDIIFGYEVPLAAVSASFFVSEEASLDLLNPEDGLLRFPTLGVGFAEVCEQCEEEPDKF